MDDKREEAMQQLFLARWNIPRAARHCLITDAECKEMFRQYCHVNPITYVHNEPK